MNILVFFKDKIDDEWWLSYKIGRNIIVLIV